MCDQNGVPKQRPTTTCQRTDHYPTVFGPTRASGAEGPGSSAMSKRLASCGGGHRQTQLTGEFAIRQRAAVTIEFAPLRDAMTFNSPLSEERATRLVDFMAEDLRGRVLDIGCGWGELLLRVVAAAPGTAGLGLDLDEAALEHGQTLAAQRGLADRVTFVPGDAKETAPEEAAAVISLGASHVWATSVDLSSPMDYAGALRAIRARVPRGAQVVYGEAVWSSKPTAEAAAALGGRLDELIGVADLVDLTVATGFVPVAVHEASLDEWDDFESKFSAAYTAWLVEHGPDGADADEVRARAQRQRDGYFRGYRGVMGLAYLQLIAV